MKKRILKSSLFIIATCILVGGATLAFLYDSAKSSNNTVNSGTLIITAQRDLGDPKPGPMFYTTDEEGLTNGQTKVYNKTGLWYPDKSVTRTLIVKNIGEFDAFLNGVSAEVSNISDPAIAREFAGEMDIVVKPSGSDTILYNGPLSGLTSGKVEAARDKWLPISAQDGIWYLNFTVTMHKDAGNNLQGLQPKVNFYVYAIQQAYQ